LRGSGSSPGSPRRGGDPDLLLHAAGRRAAGVGGEEPGCRATLTEALRELLGADRRVDAPGERAGVTVRRCAVAVFIGL
jgi:hypothetical protein